MERLANDDVPTLGGRVVGIVMDLRKRVLKHGCDLLEGDAVLQKIGRGLPRVPLESGSRHRGARLTPRDAPVGPFGRSV